MWLFIFVILTLFLSALFSGSEIAFLSASKLEIELEKDRGTRKGKILTGFYDNPQRYLSAMLVGNNIALVIFTTLLTGILEPILANIMSAQAFLLFGSTIIITLVVLLFGEFLPKTYFRKHATKLMLFLARPLSALTSLLAFPAWVMMKLSAIFLKIFMNETLEVESTTLTRLDLQNFIQDQVDDAEMFKNALNLKQTKVRGAMVPRTEIVHIDVHATIEELIEVINQSKLSRIIVINEDVEDVLGYVHHQNLIESKESIQAMLISIPFVPETMSVMDVLKLFRKEGKSIACVVDEYGGTAGIITLEDIIEEIFGEIEDEHDSEDFIDQVIDDRTFRFSGRLELDYLNEKYKQLDFPEGDHHTLSGYIVMTAGNIPEEGEELDIGKHQFTIEKVSETKVDLVKIRIQESANP